MLGMERWGFWRDRVGHFNQPWYSGVTSPHPTPSHTEVEMEKEGESGSETTPSFQLE